MLFSFAATAAWAETVYTIDSDQRLETLTVQVCLGPAPPVALAADHERAADWLRSARWSDGRRIEVRGDRLPLAGGAAKCLAYQVDLARASREHNATDVRGDRVVRIADVGAWLWLPVPAAPVRLHFELPDGVAVSLPWAPETDPQANAVPAALRYRFTHQYDGFPARSGFGHFPVSTVTVPGAQLRLAFAGLGLGEATGKLQHWVGTNALAMTTLYGRFPLPSAQVLLTPTRKRASGPVPWGQVLRGGQPAVLLTVDARHDAQAFLDDWTLSHEFSHLFFPYVMRRQAWLSEGFASYYQNVLRARAGLLTQTGAWQKLHDGFQRGLSDMRGRPLSQTTRAMHSERAYMRVYWSGVAVALLADVRIREQTGGRQSLDNALAALRDCCLPADRVWSAADLATHVDRATGTGVFSELVRQYEHSTAFPPVQKLYPRLGLEVSRGKIRLRDDAPLAPIRRAITAPASPVPR